MRKMKEPVNGCLFFVQPAVLFLFLIFGFFSPRPLLPQLQILRGKGWGVGRRYTSAMKFNVTELAGIQKIGFEKKVHRQKVCSGEGSSGAKSWLWSYLGRSRTWLCVCQGQAGHGNNSSLPIFHTQSQRLFSFPLSSLQTFPLAVSKKT